MIKQNDDLIKSLKMNIEIKKIQRIIDHSNFNTNFKKEINDFLFIQDDENSLTFSQELIPENLHFNNVLSIVKKTIIDFETVSPDINLFKRCINSKMNNFYNNIHKPEKASLNGLPNKYGNYYLTPYIVWNNRDGGMDSIISQQIYEYKEYCLYIGFFTDLLMKGISYIINEKINDEIENIALVALPRSDKNFQTTIQYSINIIEEWNSIGKTEFEYNCSKNIINCDGLLKRWKTIDSSSSGANLYEEDHINSIRYDKDFKFDLDNTAFILMDDITTHGTIMKACRTILKNNGIEENKIYSLAIGGTRGY